MADNPAQPLLQIADPIECRIVERINRFVVRVQVGGRDFHAWTNNTGRLEQFIVRGRRAFCTANSKQGKTDFRLFAIEHGEAAALVDTRFQMSAFENAVELGMIPWLAGYRIVRRDARLGDSLIDYLLDCPGKQLHLEVKSAVLTDGHHAMYPDCPTARGRKHIRDLTDLALDGGQACILFIAALPGVRAFKPNRSADPALCDLLGEAHTAGVVLRSAGIAYHPDNSSVSPYDPDLPVDLGR